MPVAGRIMLSILTFRIGLAITSTLGAPSSRQYINGLVDFMCPNVVACTPSRVLAPALVMWRHTSGCDDITAS